jgi:hypothetical protein
MKKFSEFQKECKYGLYLEAIFLHEKGTLDEFEIVGRLKRYYNFIKDFAQYAKVSIKDVAELLKNKKVFDFFSKIKFSVGNIFKRVQSGFKHFQDLKKAIADYLASTKVVKWTEEKLKDLDTFLSKHPKTKRMAGIAVGAILLYIWLNMSFTGDFDYDFDQSALLDALLGKFTLSSIFAGPEGVKLISLFVTGTLFSFPWPGPQAALFVISLLYGLAKTYKVRDVMAKLQVARRNVV